LSLLDFEVCLVELKSPGIKKLKGSFGVGSLPDVAIKHPNYLIEKKYLKSKKLSFCGEPECGLLDEGDKLEVQDPENRVLVARSSMHVKTADA
jgi:hypothetical protein